MRHSEYSANLALASRAVARAAVPTPAELARHAARQRRGNFWQAAVALACFAAIGAMLAF